MNAFLGTLLVAYIPFVVISHPCMLSSMKTKVSTLLCSLAHLLTHVCMHVIMIADTHAQLHTLPCHFHDPDC